MPSNVISIRGARTHNLRNVSTEIPHGLLTMVTGPSGSGKSSLAFDTLYAEGQRRFVESMSTYVRQFLERMERPDVEAIDGILPAIAVEQKNSVRNARSTVATATEIADYVRLFMTWAGETHCPSCGIVVRKETPESIVDRIVQRLDGSRIVVTTPVFLGEEGGEIVRQLLRGGFYRIWVDGAVADLKEVDLAGVSAVDVVLGRFRTTPDARTAILDAVEQAFSISKGFVNVLEEAGGEWASHRFSGRLACDGCGKEFAEPTPHLFSFNSPLGACEACQGYGRIIGIDLDRVIPDRTRRLDEQPIAPFNSPGYEDSYEDLERAAKKYGVRMTVPIAELTAKEWEVVYQGRGKWYGIKGFFDWLESKKYKIHVRVKLAKYRSYTSCDACGGTRLKPEARLVRFREKTVSDLFAMNVAQARRFWEYLPLSQQEEARVGHLRTEVLNRLVYLDEVGLSYLTLDRQTRTLSGGEAQRINLAAALGNGLTDTLYVIDEPTVGLHARDSERLLNVLRRLRNAGNTVVVVEHDPTMIGGADWLLEMGPGAGEGGGEVLYSGPAESRLAAHAAAAPPPAPANASKRPVDRRIVVRGARQNNLRNIDVEIPLGRLVAITGVSGSGKTSLVRDCLYNAYQRRHRGVASVDVGMVRDIEGLENVADIQLVDQSPIGRSSRSNPTTYVKAWDEIRKILASTQSAKTYGVTAGMFSFNTDGGRCEACKGSGTLVIDMQFLADVEIVCDRCEGKRFQDSVLKVSYKGKNVDRILELTVEEAIRFFVDRRAVVRKLDPLRAVGLGYLRLGQSTATLSGGEAQRLKLASFLSGVRRENNRLFLFDEPTTGLHASDVEQLLGTFRALIELGNSIVVIEHNLQMIAAADWIIDLGPEGGEGGGELVAAGTPAEIAVSPASITGRFLAGSAHAVPLSG
ncbi:MAG TPA: excinuclease ABC subunit UvrA [Thermoanaerobaculia bacterium]|nr:excinuclease ABC subunit UvrA [Thermoanaerobaculia bacterium]